MMYNHIDIRSAIERLQDRMTQKDPTKLRVVRSSAMSQNRYKNTTSMRIVGLPLAELPGF